MLEHKEVVDMLEQTINREKLGLERPPDSVLTWVKANVLWDALNYIYVKGHVRPIVAMGEKNRQWCCGECGEPISASKRDRFCRNCGTRINWDEEEI